MPVQVTLSFTAPLNASCQVGDTAYYVSTNPQLDGGFTTNGANSIVEIGQIREITPFNGSVALVKCMTDLPSAGGLASNATPFILFSKDMQQILNQ